MSVRSRIAPALRSLARRAGVRIVNRDWGPRGFGAAMELAARQGFRPRAVIDVGAARGTWTLECREVFPAATYLMVDPLPENAQALAAVAAELPGVDYWIGALGAQPGRRTIHSHGDQSSFLGSPDFKGAAIECEVRRCDDLVRERLGFEAGRRDLVLKADVQGAELEVLAGASETLAATELVLAELSVQQLYEGGPMAHEVIGGLCAHGFAILDIASYVQRPYDGALAQMDVVFAHRASRLLSHVGWE